MALLSLVWREMSHRKSQLLSGLLAITLGVAVVVGIRAVTRASEVAVALRLDNLGANVLVLPQAASVDDYYTADIDAPTMPEDFVERIVASSLPGVDNLSPKLTRRTTVAGRPVVLTGIMPAAEIASKPVWQQVGLVGADLKLTCDPNSAENEGSGFRDARLQRKAVDELDEKDCLVGSAAAERLGLKEGASVPVSDRSFRVAKVLPETGTVDDDRIFVHLRAAQEVFGIRDRVSAIEIMGCCNAISQGLLTSLRNILPDTRITSVKQIVSTQVATNGLMGRISLAFLAIVLVVGAFSIGNFLWANVNERRREIGTLRLIGAARGHVHSLLLGKALVLGIAGGVLGYLLGTLAGTILGPSLVGLTVKPVLFDLLPALGMSVGAALLGCALPAWLAGRLEPFAVMQET